jgi:hypothetical protein
MNRLILVLPFLLLAACASSGSFPSLQPRPGEIPRVIEAPGAGEEARLSVEQRESLQADVEREEKALAATEAEVASAGAALDKALAKAKGAAKGSEGWSDAQMALSRFDLARTPFGEIEARLTPLLRIVDSLDSDDPDRQAVESLASSTASASAAAERRVQAAMGALGG